MHEARLVRFGAGKAHLGAAFHALRVFVETPGLVLWHCAAPHVGCWHPARYGSTIGKLGQPTGICPSHAEGVPHQSRHANTFPQGGELSNRQIRFLAYRVAPVGISIVAAAGLIGLRSTCCDGGRRLFAMLAMQASSEVETVPSLHSTTADDS
jgi:hypothetical protein